MGDEREERERREKKKKRSEQRGKGRKQKQKKRKGMGEGDEIEVMVRELQTDVEQEYVGDDQVDNDDQNLEATFIISISFVNLPQSVIISQCK